VGGGPDNRRMVNGILWKLAIGLSGRARALQPLADLLERFRHRWPTSFSAPLYRSARREYGWDPDPASGH
jgi:hypothetical protein